MIVYQYTGNSWLYQAEYYFNINNSAIVASTGIPKFATPEDDDTLVYKD